MAVCATWAQAFILGSLRVAWDHVAVQYTTLVCTGVIVSSLDVGKAQQRSSLL
jgi:hypothetical protein